MLSRWAAALGAIVVAALAAAPADARCPKPQPTLMCVLSPTAGNSVGGTITLSPYRPRGGPPGVLINANITGLPPRTVHGWHVHEFGDVSAATGKATGGHYNPAGVAHGLPSGMVRHQGDIGNLPAADDAGSVVVQRQRVPKLQTKKIIGRAMIIHELTDDGGQPTGNAGARLAQCVLGVADSVKRRTGRLPENRIRMEQ